MIGMDVGQQDRRGCRSWPEDRLDGVLDPLPVTGPASVDQYPRVSRAESVDNRLGSIPRADRKHARGDLGNPEFPARTTRHVTEPMPGEVPSDRSLRKDRSPNRRNAVPCAVDLVGGAHPAVSSISDPCAQTKFEVDRICPGVHSADPQRWVSPECAGYSPVAPSIASRTRSA
jgi:hypothetical protein